MVALSGRLRSLIAAVGAATACAGFALVPLYGQPATDRGPNSLRPGGTTVTLPSEPNARLPAVSDPFARKWDDGGNVAAHQAGHLPRQRHDPVVEAIVSGERPMALIRLADGATRIVARGDLLDSVRVVGIEPQSVILDDHRRLRLLEPEP